MNKTDLVKAIADSADLSQKQAAAALDGALDGIKGALAKGDNVQLIGFGTFEVRERAARAGRNPQTGEAIQIKASKSAAFKAGKALKDAL